MSKIATELSRKLLDESQQWQVLKQSARNRRDAWRVALSVTVAALTLFVGGYVTAEWRKSADRADQAVLAAVQQCGFAVGAGCGSTRKVIEPAPPRFWPPRGRWR